MGVLGPIKNVALSKVGMGVGGALAFGAVGQGIGSWMGQVPDAIAGTQEEAAFGRGFRTAGMVAGSGIGIGAALWGRSAYEKGTLKSSGVNAMKWAGGKGAGLLRFASKKPVIGALAVGALGVGLAAGLLGGTGEGLTSNLNVTSGESYQMIRSMMPGNIGAFTGMTMTRMMGNYSSMQSSSNLRGGDYAAGIASMGNGNSGPMSFSPVGYERGMGGASGAGGVDGNLTLSLSNLRRGR